MSARKLVSVIMAIIAVAGCSSAERLDDRAAIERIAEDIEEGVRTGDLLTINRHLSTQARELGFEGNRFLMESSYGGAVQPQFTAKTIKLMGDSAHLAFTLMPIGMQYSDSLPRSVVRLVRIMKTWKIASFHLMRNQLEIDVDSLL